MVWSREQNTGFDSLISKKWRGDSAGPLSDVFRTARSPDQLSQPGNPRDALKPRTNDANLTAPPRTNPQAKPEPAQQTDTQNKPAAAEKPAAHAADKSAPKQQDTNQQETKPAHPRLKAAFAPLAMAVPTATSAMNNKTDPSASYRQGDEFKTGTQSEEARKKRRQLYTQDTEETNHKKDDVDEFAQALERINEEQERFNQYINEMNAYLDSRIEITQEDINQLFLKIEEIDRRNQAEAELQVGIQNDVVIITDALETSDQTLAQIDAKILEQNRLREEIEKENDKIKEEIETLSNHIDGLSTELDKITSQEQAAGNDVSINDLLAQYSRMEASGHIQAIQALEKSIQQSESLIKAAESKPFTDENGSQIHKDEKGYYLLDKSGNKQHYKEDQQKELGEKAKAEGLMTPEEIERERATIKNQNELLQKQRLYASQSHNEGEQHQENRDNSERDRLFYRVRRDELSAEITTARGKLDEMEDTSKELGREIKNINAEIKALEKQRDQEGENNKFIKEQLAQKNQQLLDSQARMKENNKQRQEYMNELKGKQNDLITMHKLKEQYTKLEKATPEERKNIEQEIQKIKDKMTPEERERFEKYDKAALEKRTEYIKSYEASSPQNTSIAAKTATNPPTKETQASLQSENTSRTTGTMAAMLEGGQIKADVKASNEFSAAAAGKPPLETPANHQDNLILVSKAPSTGAMGVRP